MSNSGTTSTAEEQPSSRTSESTPHDPFNGLFTIPGVPPPHDVLLYGTGRGTQEVYDFLHEPLPDVLALIQFQEFPFDTKRLYVQGIGAQLQVMTSQLYLLSGQAARRGMWQLALLLDSKRAEVCRAAMDLSWEWRIMHVDRSAAHNQAPRF